MAESETTLGGRHDTLHPGIGLQGHPQGTSKRLEYRLCNMMGIPTPQIINMQGHGGVIYETLEKLKEQLSIELSNRGSRIRDLANQTGAA
jgi:hypothetical protein